MIFQSIYTILSDSFTNGMYFYTKDFFTKLNGAFKSDLLTLIRIIDLRKTFLLTYKYRDPQFLSLCRLLGLLNLRKIMKNSCQKRKLKK